jgi:MoaA/NifB/PqqE/SkfB family radical SAM enzyme
MSHILRRLPILVLQPHPRCNCRCVMCDIWKVTSADELSAADLQRHLADIQSLGVQWAVFTGGEPLMHGDLFRLCRMLRDCGVRTTILSSGLLLERHAAAIVAHAADVIVSLDGPPEIHDRIRAVPRAFELLAAGVRAIHRLAPDFPITARCTVQAANATHLRRTAAAAETLGLRSISFLAADVDSSAFNRPNSWTLDKKSTIAPEVTTLDSEIEALIAVYAGNPFVVESPAKLRRITAHFRAHAGLEAHIAPRCNAPWVSAVLESNGDVRPCFFHPPIGNASNATLSAIVNGPAALVFRESLNVAENPVCRRCVCSLYRPPNGDSPDTAG